ncbi:MAG: enoyl-CoA hydratase-related protein [Xanthomonadales bacterium]|nr:enoyl-CoA hydratase-related protein [Xanthomonadales bacterium]
MLTLTLDRAEFHNAFNAELIAELDSALTAAARDESLRAVVLTGSGRSFSAGADLAWMRAQAEATESENRADAVHLADMLRHLNFFPVPTIARVNGHAFGGGVGLLACCDIAIAARSARFGLTEARLGLVPAVISPYVISAIGERQARRYFMTAERFDADQAQRIGLVHEVVDEAELDNAVEEVIEALRAGGPKAVPACKSLVFDVTEQSEDRQAALDAHNAALIARLRVSPEGQEGLAAFLDKREPDWRAPEDDN